MDDSDAAEVASAHDDGDRRKPSTSAARSRRRGSSTNVLVARPNDAAEVERFADASVQVLQRGLLEYSRRTSPSVVLRACFVALVRSNQEGITRFDRLLKNVADRLPAMAHRYPFVGLFDPDTPLGPIADALNRRRGFAPGHKSGGKQPLRHVFPAGVRLEALSDDDMGHVPPWVQPEHNHPWMYPSTSYWGVGYRHMCRFFAVRIPFVQPLAEFDFYMRLDTDSYILATPLTSYVRPARELVEPVHEEIRAADDADDELPQPDAARVPDAAAAGIVTGESFLNQIGFEESVVYSDFFREAAALGARYSYSMVHPQPTGIFLTQLFESADEFLRHEPSPIADVTAGGFSTFEAPRGLGLHYWDNVEIVDLRLFRPTTATAGSHSPASAALDDPTTIELQRKVSGFLRHMDKKGGIYYYRWGDAEIRTLTMTLFVDRKRIAYMNGLPYQHYHNFHCPRQESVLIAAAMNGSDASETDNSNHDSKQDALVPSWRAVQAVVASLASALDEGNAAFLVEKLSNVRAVLRVKVGSECETAAQRATDGKGVGSAPMHPAELPPNNDLVYRYNAESCSKSPLSDGRFCLQLR